MAKRLVVFSDLHCGSVFGMLPPDFVTSFGATVSQNAGQKYTWECWLDFAHKVKAFKPDIFIVNGDVIDGKQRKQEGTELALNLLLDQEEAAVQTCMVLKNAAPEALWFFTQGTEYHDGNAAHSLENVASRLGAEKYPGVGGGRYAREVLDIDIEGIGVNVMHHISGTGGIYRATPLDRETMWASLSGKEGKANRADLLIRSHVHYFSHLEYLVKHAVITPCWELQTRFMRKRSAYRMLPDLGAIFITIDGKAKERGEDPCHIKKIHYAIPVIKPYKLA